MIALKEIMQISLRTVFFFFILANSTYSTNLASGQMTSEENSKIDVALSNRPKSQKIEEAVSAGPAAISRDAKIVEMMPGGEMNVLREGSNAWTCTPKQSDTQPAMCADQASMQWFEDFMAHKPKPSNTVPGITYMLAGATQRSDSDPYDNKSPLIQIGPHWMILWPFDPKATGLPTTHRPAGAYIMWAGSPYAHVHIMGNPLNGSMNR